MSRAIHLNTLPDISSLLPVSLLAGPVLAILSRNG